MNFDRIPYIHNQYGFFIAIALMLIIPVWMIVSFRKRGMVLGICGFADYGLADWFVSVTPSFSTRLYRNSLQKVY